MSSWRWRKKSTLKVEKTEYQKARDRADAWMSKYIRLRDADENGYCRCITCGKIMFWQDDHRCQNGHYIGRGNMNTRFDEKNCHAQCFDCNCNHEGWKQHYEKALIEKYGEQEVALLEKRGHEFRKFSAFELRAIADYYRKRFNELKKLKRWQK